MPTGMLDRLQENKLHGLEELIDSWRLVASGDGDEQGAIADVIVDEGIGLRQGLLRIWELHWSKALVGDIANRKEDGEKLQTLLKHGGRVLARGAAVALLYANQSGLEVARLSQFEEQVKAFPLWAQECITRWEMLDRPRKALNQERLARSRAAYERGECEDTSNILTRLEQGGPIAKE